MGSHCRAFWKGFWAAVLFPPHLDVGVRGPRVYLPAPAAAPEQPQVMSWMPVEFSKANKQALFSLFLNSSYIRDILSLCVFDFHV